MSTLKIELTLSEGDSQATELGVNLIKAYGHIDDTEEAKPVEKPKRAPRKKAEAPKEEAPKEEAPKEEAPKEEAPKEEANEPTHKIEDVRAEVAKKVKTKGNRGIIREKLNELGSKNVTNLSPDKYDEMFEFLQSLD